MLGRSAAGAGTRRPTGPASRCPTPATGRAAEGDGVERADGRAGGAGARRGVGVGGRGIGRVATVGAAGRAAEAVGLGAAARRAPGVAERAPGTVSVRRLARG